MDLNWRVASRLILVTVGIAASGGCGAAGPAVPPEVLQHWNAGIDRANHFDWAGAVRELDIVITAMPGAVPAIAMRGDMHIRLQHWSEAKADLSRAIALYGADKRAVPSLLLRAHMLGMEKDTGGELADVERAIGLDPNSAEAHYMRAAALWRRGDNSAALEAIDRSLVLDPEAGLHHQMRGMVLEAMGNLSGARAELDVGVQREPKMFMTWSSRADVDLKMGDAANARDDAKHALVLFPAHAHDHLTLAIAEALLGDVHESAAELRGLAARTPAELSAHTAAPGAAPDDTLVELTRDSAHGARAELAWGLVCVARAEKAAAERHFEAALSRDASLKTDVSVARAEAQQR